MGTSTLTNELRQDAIRAVTKALEDSSSLSTLSACASKTLDITNGKVATLFPLGAPGRVLPGLQDGYADFLLDPGLILAEHIQDYLCSGDHRVAVFPDLSFDAASPAINRMVGRIGIFNREVYHVLVAEGMEIEQIRQIERQAGSPWLTICYMSQAKLHRVIENPRFVLTEMDVAEIADKTDAIAVQAYDGEGYLMWRKI